MLLFICKYLDLTIVFKSRTMSQHSIIYNSIVLVVEMVLEPCDHLNTCLINIHQSSTFIYILL